MSAPQTFMGQILAGRPKVEGFTIDKEGTLNHDDAFYITRHKDGTTTVEVSISDTPALVPAGSRAYVDMQNRVSDFFYGTRKVWSMLSPKLVENFLSLQEQQERPAITFTIELDKNMDVEDVDIRRTAFRNKSRATPLMVDHAVAAGNEIITGWVDVAKRLYAKRQEKLMDTLAYNVPEKLKRSAAGDGLSGSQGAGEFLVHEIMALTNRVATDYMKKHKLPMATVTQGMRISEQFGAGSGSFLTRSKNTMDIVRKKLGEHAEQVTVTSPNRKSVDLVNLTTIINHVEGRSTPIAETEMKQTAHKFTTVTSEFKHVCGTCRTEEEARAALASLIVKDVEAVAAHRMPTVQRMQKAVERAHFCNINAAARETMRTSKMYLVLEGTLGRPELMVSNLQMGGTELAVAILQTRDQNGRKGVNVTVAGATAQDALEQAATAALIHAGKIKTPGR